MTVKTAKKKQPISVGAVDKLTRPLGAAVLL